MTILGLARVLAISATNKMDHSAIVFCVEVCICVCVVSRRNISVETTGSFCSFKLSCYFAQYTVSVHNDLVNEASLYRVLFIQNIQGKCFIHAEL